MGRKCVGGGKSGSADDRELTEQRINETRGMRVSKDGGEGENSNKDTSLLKLQFSSSSGTLSENGEKGNAAMCSVNDGEAAMMQF